MRIAMFTNEYPPHVYGGAGVHIEYLARELAAAEGGTHSIEVFPFGEQRETRGNLRVQGVAPALRFSAQDPRHAKLLDALVRDLAMVSAVQSPTSSIATRGTHILPAASPARSPARSSC